ncbi:ArsR/SmtB family transcription factor [Microlunatus endophyticus]|uniref:ArsR/SmtB family transcription factor n=1 Tax=Microlunatus endophyticus TaxID=1716077 RepID=UPI001E599776|nr:winged helix-turn-helix domain-containing protein [Microlunatus endophyticus]
MTEIPPLIDTSDPASMRALSHPTRHRLLAALGDGQATISQLTNRLAINKGNVAHHLGVLVDAGLVRKGPTRTVRGGTEQYYLRAHSRLDVTGDEPARAMLDNLTAQILADASARLNHRVLRLTARQAIALADHLDSVVHHLAPAPEREERYGVLVGVYRHRDVLPPPTEP